jgi:hypothetical protein
MTRRGMVLLSVGILAILAMLVPAQNAVAAGWSDHAYYDQGQFQQHHGRHGGNGGGLLSFGPTTKKIARVGLLAAGTVVAGLFGSQFGTVGTIVGGAAGFLVSRWLGDKLFGENRWDQGQTYGQSWLGKLKDKIFGRKEDQYRIQPYPYGGPRWSQINAMGGSQDLGAARRDLYQAGEDLKRALQTGTDAEKQSSKAAYDAARETFYRLKTQSGQ